MSKSVLPMFSSGGFMVLGLAFRSLMHFEFIFVYGVRKCFFKKNFFSYTWGLWKFLGQGLSLSHCCHLCHRCNITRSFNSLHWAKDWTHTSAVTQATVVRFLTHCTTMRSRRCSDFILLHVAIQFSQYHLLKGLFFLHLCSCLLCCRLIDHKCLWFISVLSILFHWSMCLFLC